MVGKDKLLMPVVFTIVVSASIFALCTIWEYESKSGFFDVSGSLFDFLPNPFVEKQSGILDDVSRWWRKLTKNEQIYWPIFGLNILIFIAWQISSLTPVMLKWFCTTYIPGHPVAVPMVLSIFSHASLLHLAANMSALYSITPFAAELLGREMFVALFLVSGIVSSLGSYTHQVLTGRYFRSLGASGALCGISAIIYSKLPQLQVQFFFLPGVFISATSAVHYLLIFDVFCLLAGQHYFDHAAHVAGFLFGLYVHKFGDVPIGYVKGVTLKFWQGFHPTSGY
ncbi:unnamed protein product [Allacma fusca]|uniref:Peptidase S54 rhomboid domain-containing protein n=1 Tax=Allacma fusca TaxID=39272 RepID=A0A8J2LAG1_9HEXA|nr:unnamed protein product [Allacma fusca]